MKRVVISLVLCALLNVNLFAQSTDLFLSLEKGGVPGVTMPDIVVAKEEIENKNSPAALDLIASAPGIFVTKAASQIKSDVTIRGIGDSFRRIGLFVDGRPEKMSVYGCGVTQTLLSNNVEKIEITKGPDPVLYGSDGFGGVINIITALPVKPFEGQISASYGTYNTQGYFVNAGGVKEDFLYQLSANKRSSDGHLPRSGYDVMDYSVKVGHIIDDFSEIIIGGKYFDGKEFEPRARNTKGIIQPISFYNFRRGAADIRYNKEYHLGKYSILAFGDFGDHNFSDGFNSKDWMYGVYAHFENEIFENNLLKYGAEYRLSDGKVIKGPRKGEWKKSEIALFAMDEHNFNDKAKVFAGLRFNYDEISGNSLSPRAGINYSFTDKIAARATYSRGFRSPYINELYSLPISNDQLKPEELNSYEIGLNSKYLGVDIDLSCYVMNGDNIIQAGPKKPGPGFEFQNSGSYVFKGTDLSVSAEIIEGLKGFAGYSYLDPGEKTAGIVKNKVDLGLDYKIGKFTFYTGGMLVFDYYATNMDRNNGTKLNDFNVFNAKIHYNVNDNITVFAATDNFTDQKYEMFIVSFGNDRIYEMPGSTFTLGAKYKF